jgi:hypothetical protein
MADASSGSLPAGLVVLAVRLVLPGFAGLDVDQAITLACDLLVRDLDTPATAAVAGLPWGASLSESGPVIRDMLREQGFPVPGPGGSPAEEFAFVLRAVAAGGLPVSDLYVYFMRRIPAWEQQDELQRRLVVLLNDWDGETTPGGMAAAAAAVREFAREAAPRVLSVTRVVRGLVPPDVAAGGAGALSMPLSHWFPGEARRGREIRGFSVGWLMITKIRHRIRCVIYTIRKVFVIMPMLQRLAALAGRFLAVAPGRHGCALRAGWRASRALDGRGPPSERT